MKRSAAAVAVLAVLAAGCGAEQAADGSGGSKGPATGTPTSSAERPRWAYEDVARDAQGEFLDVAAPAADDIWATASYRNGGRTSAGQQHLFHYDGRRWERRRMPAELDGAVHQTRLRASGPDNVWLFGTGDDGTRIARWDGTRWHRVPSGFDFTPGDPLVLAPDDVWVLVGGEAEHWDGTRWSPVDLPAAAGTLGGTSSDDLWAVGNRDSGPGTEVHSQPAAMHWDGRGWQLTDTPVFRFPDPQPPEPSGSLDRVVVVSEDEVWAYGGLSFNHGEVENEPSDVYFTLRWDGTRWTDVTADEPGCAKGRDPVPDGHGGVIYLDRWHFTADGVCRRTARSKLPSTGGITPQARQSLWFARIVPIPGTRKLIAAGHMQVNQSGNPMAKPLLATLELER